MDIEKLDFEKIDGFIFVIIQDVKMVKVLMLGYMNKVVIEKI